MQRYKNVWGGWWSIETSVAVSPTGVGVESGQPWSNGFVFRSKLLNHITLPPCSNTLKVALLCDCFFLFDTMVHFEF